MKLVPKDLRVGFLLPLHPVLFPFLFLEGLLNARAPHQPRDFTVSSEILAGPLPDSNLETKRRHSKQAGLRDAADVFGISTIILLSVPSGR